ncbi:MAG: hypothetical protein ACOX1P_33310 [Thermoguttaceae bacterium]
MFTLFLFCAVLGGVVLVCQIVMTIAGAGLGGGDVDMPSDAGGFGDVHLDVGHGDVNMDLGHGDVHGGDLNSEHADSTAGFRVISLRTVIAGVTFFGLGGLAADSTGATPVVVWAIALAAGAAAMYGVYWMFRTLYSLKSDGTVQIANAIGQHGTVYLRIPGNDSGTGKIQMCLQSRTVEYLATTTGEGLPTGTRIVVVDVVTPTTVQVEPVLEPERNEHV